MQDVIHALHRAPAGFEPRGVASNEPNAMAHGAQILAATGREIIENGDLCAVAHESLDEM
jgi:hypothetical protein